MIAVYTGNLKDINIGNKTFIKNVPTFVEPRLREQIKLNNEFDLYNPKLEYASGGRILIILPNKLSWVIGCQVVIARIKRYHPTCELDIVVAQEYNTFINGGEKYNAIPQNRYYYRKFDLSLHKNQNWLSEFNLKGHTKEQLLLLISDLFEIEFDKISSVTYLNKQEDIPITDEIAILTKGRNIANTLQGTDELIAMLMTKYKIKIIDKTDLTDIDEIF